MIFGRYIASFLIKLTTNSCYLPITTKCVLWDSLWPFSDVSFLVVPPDVAKTPK